MDTPFATAYALGVLVTLLVLVLSDFRNPQSRF